MNAPTFQPPTDEEIAEYAYYLWENEGRFHGRDLEYWFQAKTHLVAHRQYEAGLLQKLKVDSKRTSPTVGTATEKSTKSGPAQPESAPPAYA